MSEQGWWGINQPMPWGGGPDWPTVDWQKFYGNAAGGGREAQEWYNTILPWYQQAQVERQFGAQMDWQKQLAQQQEALQRWQTQGGWTQEQWLQNAQSAWAREQQKRQLEYERWAQTGQLGWYEQEQQRQLDYERWATSGGWEQQKWMQEQQGQLQRELSEAELASQEKQSAWQAFGHKWNPNTRWG